MREFHRLVFVCCVAGELIPAAYADSLVAAYTFNDTLAAVEPGVAALTAVKRISGRDCLRQHSEYLPL
jgi:hypothetical protein